MKKILFLLLLCMMAGTAGAQRKVSSGLLVGGGVGFARNADDWYGLSDFFYTWSVYGKMEYKGNTALGYRVRIEPERSSHFFFDMDFWLNAKFYKDIDVFYEWEERTNPIVTVEANDARLSFAFSPSVNYRITERLYAGLGLEPTVYFSKYRLWDIPIVWKVGYNFGRVDVALNYRLGLAHTLDKHTLFRGEVSDLNLSVFIPFHVK